jgi:hypothetical protein
VVLGTDYDNYAQVYGCDSYFFFWKIEYATLLSRKPFLEAEYTSKAKYLLNEVKYDHRLNWDSPGTYCGYEASDTYDEIMISVFDHEPLWTDYQYYNENT